MSKNDGLQVEVARFVFHRPTKWSSSHDTKGRIDASYRKKAQSDFEHTWDIHSGQRLHWNRRRADSDLLCAWWWCGAAHIFRNTRDSTLPETQQNDDRPPGIKGFAQIVWVYIEAAHLLGQARSVQIRRSVKNKAKTKFRNFTIVRKWNTDDENDTIG